MPVAAQIFQYAFLTLDILGVMVLWAIVRKASRAHGTRRPLLLTVLAALYTVGSLAAIYTLIAGVP